MAQKSMSTPRLHLQPLNEAHLVHFKELNSRPEVFRFIHEQALTEQEATDDHAARLAAGTLVPGLGVWSDLLADGGEFVGGWALSPVGCGLAQALDDSQPDIVLSLRNVHEFNSISEQYAGMIRTNGLPIGADGSDAGIFEHACRINHVCSNNAQKSWDENLERHTVHALRDMQQGEEIIISYLRKSQPETSRLGSSSLHMFLQSLCVRAKREPRKRHQTRSHLKA
ncbi:SET domain-containing protein 5 [Beauveria brongniartii RCEF 3172]|uniref:SET domain-containing protein 5 n=1 Tax=Beauveria brongniartii RCEF 3172 TaxID=1081107 RepID=A0A167ZFS5_9HYPO|nr:SET domain-containing protein 5 [Beauveria brongniartii RCEF 3172]